MNYYLGIDLGSSSIKFIIIDEAGTIVGDASKDYAISMPKPDWREIEPNLWFEALICGIKELFSVTPKDVTEKIIRIGVTGQMHTTVFLDGQGNSVRPAIMWNDNRTSSCMTTLKEQISSYSDISYITNIISPGSPAANLYWLKSYEPVNFKRIKKFLIAPDYIVYRLTGTYSTDYCEASTSSLYDLYSDTWSPAIQKLIGLPSDAYPTIKGSSEIAGSLLPAIAKELNLSPNVKVIVGTGDNPAAGIATGCLIDQQPVLSIGTSGVLMATRNNIDVLKKGKNIRFSHDGKEVITMVQGAVQSAGSSLSWWMRDIMESPSFDVDAEAAKNSSYIEKNILFYPHLVGDKTIHANPKLRGAFINISTDTTRTDMQIAVMEGICFAFRELMESMDIHPDRSTGLKVTGGGARSIFWMQMLADILNTKIEPLGSNAGACYGIALLAQACYSGSKLHLNLTTRTKGSYIIPNYDDTKQYDKKYFKYKRIYSALNYINTADIMENEHENM